MKDYEVLRVAESRYFHLFYTMGEQLGSVEQRTDVTPLLKMFDASRDVLVVKDDGNCLCQCGKMMEVSSQGLHDAVIYAVCGQMAAVDRYRSIFWAMHSVRSGGLFMAVPESYEAMRDGTVLMDFIMGLSGFRIMVPLYDFAGIGVKK